MSKTLPRLYLLTSLPDRFKSILPRDSAAWDLLSRLDGTQRHLDISAIEWQYSPAIMERSRGKCDFPHLASHIPVFAARAMDCFDKLLCECGEFVPFSCGLDKYFLFNVTKVLDILCHARSDVRRFESSGRVSHVPKHVLHLPPNAPAIFKIVEDPVQSVFVTREFQERISEHRLTGFCFTDVEVCEGKNCSGNRGTEGGAR